MILDTATRILKIWFFGAKSCVCKSRSYSKRRAQRAKYLGLYFVLVRCVDYLYLSWFWDFFCNLMLRICIVLWPRSWLWAQVPAPQPAFRVCFEVSNPPQWAFTKIFSRDQTADVAGSKERRRKKERLKKKKSEKKKRGGKITSVLAAGLTCVI